ncbi:Putative niacin/nicotinamide transporter NaiP [Pandoraea aquatica]|uniref:Niacin/nicotinamide transporter NaiP n=1 Tax=Pandoraea aquatica TaxID=2508290 RepID=A0A5E4W3R8_9BURK|nr:MFS transporter [Pandoraea aquatica]VVE19278.1 Putative niacin/nicotinamide transporter NaiP [Pandoraea aquatica]
MQMQSIEVSRVSAAQRLERLPVCGYHRWLFLVISLAFFFDNIDLATMAFLLGSIKADFALTNVQAGMIGSASFVGMAIGAICSGVAADRFGRKPVFQISMLVWGAGSALCALAPGPVALGACRVLLGIGMGMELPLAQTLLSEFIPTQKRGKYLALMDGNWPLAFICAGLLSYAILAQHSWRVLFALEAAPALFLFAVRRYVPESARWLESQGRYAEADEVVANIERSVMRRLGLDTLPSISPTPVEPIAGGRGLRVIWSANYRVRTLVVGGLWFFALLGFYGLNTWLGALQQAAGIAVTKSVLFTVYISLGGIPGFLAAAWAVERIGRKLTCVTTLAGGAIATYVFGQLLQVAAAEWAIYAAGACMQFFAFGMWAVLYAYTPELFPSRARATGCGYASLCGRIGALLGPTLVGAIVTWSTSDAVFLFSATCFGIAAACVWCFGIETRGSQLETVST